MALDGQPGVLDTIKALRSRPFGEWNIVYFDGKKNGAKELLARLKANGCKDATLLTPVSEQVPGWTLMVTNPIATPGDCFRVSFRPKEDTPQSPRPKLEVPKGWHALEAPAATGGLDVYVQTPRDAAEGQHILKIAGTRETLRVELVARVK